MSLSTPISIHQLHCEYQHNPLGLGVLKPRLSWQLAGSGRGIRQSAYRLIVADCKALIDKNTGNIWDTQRVESDRSIHVEYEGRPVRSRQRYYWKVQVWDEREQPSEWSETASWEMGLLDEWHAGWISAEIDHPACPYFRYEFKAPAEVASARIYATALGTYELHLNGNRVGDAHFTPGWTSYHNHIQYQPYDVTAQVQAGKNAIGAIVADGWYRGHQMVFTGGTQREAYGNRLALRLQLHIDYVDGSTEIVPTNSQWRSGTGAIQFADHYLGETHDLRLAPAGWSETGFDDSTWAVTHVIEPAIGKIVAQDGPLVRKMAEIRPIEILTTPNNETVFDFGQNMVGWVQLTANGPAGTAITLRHAEILDADGNFYTANLRAADQTVTYILDGNGEQTLEPRFSFQGFRYVAVNGYPGTLTLDSLVGIVAYSDMGEMGQFECSNPMLNQLQQNIVWGQRGNFLDLPTDCPQ
ncbi:MAG: family 78 glycoside hydrolase catalytic domain, partial [Anaerolineae bacterium]